MVKIRMRRTGCTNHATYRIVAADSRSPRDGKFLEILGWYDTQIKENNFRIDLARVDYWLSHGAKPSTTVASLIRRAKNPALKPHHATPATETRSGMRLWRDQRCTASAEEDCGGAPFFCLFYGCAVNEKHIILI